jgi:hypothetical protein
VSQLNLSGVFFVLESAHQVWLSGVLAKLGTFECGYASLENVHEAGYALSMEDSLKPWRTELKPSREVNSVS